MDAFLQQLSRIGPTRLILMFGVAAGVAFALTAVSMRLGENNHALLFAGLDLRESSEIVQRLDQAGVGYELRDGGASVYVERGSVDQARMMVAAEGLPSAGTVGYEIFDDQDGLGASRFVQNVNLVRALEGELARTIRALDGVASARVHLALPERRLFERDAVQPTASVWIELRRADLGARHANAIRTLVSSAVPDLSADQVTILDSEGRVLARGGGDDPTIAASGAMDDRRAGIEDRIRQRVLDLVEGITGPSTARVQVAADVDFNRVTETQTIFDPEGRVMRAVTREEESSRDEDLDEAGAVSVSENVPEGEEADDVVAPTSTSTSNRTRETTNFEISQRTRTEQSEVGVVRRVSVAVAVDGLRAIGDDGEVQVTPRSPEQISQIEALVRSAIGFDEERGDVVTVSAMEFARTPMLDTSTGAPGAFSFDMDDAMRAAELGVLLVVALMIIFLVARPLMQGAVGGAPALAGAGGGRVAMSRVGGGSGELITNDSATLSDASGGGGGGGGNLPAPDGEDESIDLERIQGRVRASSIKKVSEIVTNHPDETLSIVRNWLHNE